MGCKVGDGDAAGCLRPPPLPRGGGRGGSLAKRPFIGIPCRIDAGKDQFYLRKHYSEALFHAGGTPVLLPLIPEKVYAEELVRGLDAILISGSNSDVDPHRYGQEPHPKIGSIVT